MKYIYFRCLRYKDDTFMYCRFHDVLINSINAKKIEGAIVMKMAVTRTDTQLVPFYNINYDIGPRLREATVPV